MGVTETPFEGVLILEPKVFGDPRGFFLESWNHKDFHHATGLNVDFVQDNHSHSKQGVLRGLHYQIQQPQGKLVRTVKGKVLDVVVDLRQSSSTFGQYLSIELSDDNHHQLWIPPGFAHGFVVLSEIADILYKTTDYYSPEYERHISWNDPYLGIDWQLNGMVPILSLKDQRGESFQDASFFP